MVDERVPLMVIVFRDTLRMSVGAQRGGVGYVRPNEGGDDRDVSDVGG